MSGSRQTGTRETGAIGFHVLRSPASIAALEDRLASLVHPGAAADAAERARHVRFMTSRLAVGLAALALLPLYLAVFGRLAPMEMLVAGLALMPLAAVALLSATGRIDLAHAASSVALAGIVVAVAVPTGGLQSPALVALLLVPLEAVLSGSRRAILATVLVSGAALAAVAAVDAGVAAPASHGAARLAGPVAVLLVIARAAWIGWSLCGQADRAARMADGRDARQQAVLDAIRDVVVWQTPNGHVGFASAAAERLLGATPRSLVGRGLFERVHVADRPAYLNALAEAGRRPGEAVVEVRLRRDGAAGNAGAPHFVWVEMAARRADIPGAEPVVVSVLHDIGERKAQEAAAEEARTESARAVEMKDRFLATVSHELRTPLNAIIGFSEILGGDAIGVVDEARRKEYAGIIRTSGEHLLDIVNALLNVSKIESGSFDITPEPFDMRQLAHACCDLVQLKADGGCINLVRDWSADLPEVVADPRACRQILINLLSNALKFTPSGGTVTVSLRRIGDELVMSVRDTGIGIAEADLGRIGDPFFQARSSYDRPYEGTGLGLSVVRGFVGLHRGRMSVETAPEQGTVVTITLPLDCRTDAPSLAGPATIHAIPRAPRAGAAPVPLKRIA